MDAWRVVRKADATRLLQSRVPETRCSSKRPSPPEDLIGIVDGRPQWTQWAD